MIALAAGCGGRAQLEISPLRFDALDPPKPFATRVALEDCTWRERPDGQVEIAMQKTRRLWFGPADEVRFELSLRLEKLPAGKARFYKVDQGTLRAVVRMGPLQGRFVSTTGIVMAHRPAGGRLRGSLRLLATRELAQLLGGYGAPARYLFQGAFDAVRDEQRTAAIVGSTESNGFEREAARDRPPRSVQTDDLSRRN
ncbi:MAG: hypothetical protein D6744_04985 [Planctomycetota bacterium]|nr:MAG: hypothetical protein D6744_04985 [Planctomycetota bacterium]